MNPRTRDHRPGRLCAALLIGCVWAPQALAQDASSPAVGQVRRLLVKLHESGEMRSAAAARSIIRGLSETAAVPLTRLRRMSGGIEVVQLPDTVTATRAQALARRLMLDPNVEAVEPDRWVAPLLVPNDPDYSSQWHLQDSRSEVAAANLPEAWDLSTGAASIVVAVIDTGLVAHADLDHARIRPGYDFVSDVFIANDGDGRDADPSDPGDWTSDGDAGRYGGCASEAESSSWHGTHVAGIVAASGNNRVGVVGVNWNSKVLPVRVLGKCGGFLSDVLDGIRWAAGISDPSFPANPYPARVLNLSLGAATTCTPLVQGAIDDALAAGAVVVAAAGNNAADASGIAPGNCAGVIAVSALDRQGNKAYYASTGSTVALSAPGGAQVYVNGPGGILSLSNAGTTTPVPSPDGDLYHFLQGTSMSAPQVAGVASLMLSVNPGLTPTQVRRKLRATARPFPGGSTCTTALCGAGMLDAAVALQSAANTTPPVADAGADQEARANTTATLNAAASIAAAPASIAAYRWVQVSGQPVKLSNANSASPTFFVPGEAGKLRFQLTIVDDGGLTATDTVDVEVIAAVSDSSNMVPNASGSGGDSRCFIATAAYGTPDAGDVLWLRRFRDRYLLTNAPGRVFIRAYYRLSPPLADVIRAYPLLRRLVRIGLVPYVALARWASAPSAPAH